MASLYNTLPQDTYSGLIKFIDNTGSVGPIKQLTDGVGVILPMYFGTSSVYVTSISGSITGSFSGSLIGTSTTASYVTASNVFGPYGANSVISSSYALTASFALNGGSGGGGTTDTGSLLVTASVSSNTITFTKGNASTFNITVNTGSGGTPGGTNTSVQYNSGSTFAGNSYFTFNYSKNALSLGSGGGGTPSATGTGSLAVGFINTNGNPNYIIASGRGALAQGYAIDSAGTAYISASGDGAFAHGYAFDNILEARGIGSHAEGQNTIAIGVGSHAEGISTTASGSYSHAEGNLTQAIGQASHASGLGTIAQADNQLVIGKYNVTSSDAGNLFIIGNGTNSSTRRNLAVFNTASISFTSCSLAVGNITPSATVGRIDASNDVVAYSTSDIRLKENITPILNPIAKIEAIGGYTFDWKSEHKDLHGFEGHDVGVIAQEIEVIMPEVVTTRDNGYKAVKYEKIVPLLIEAIKDLQKQVDELKNR
jgi:hypothetical protein